MTSFVYRPDHELADEFGFVSKDLVYTYNPNDDKRATIGNQLVTFNYIGDEMEPTRHMVDGKYYTSKKKFRNETKARGCIEIGNDTKAASKPKTYIPATDKKTRREHIKQAMYQLRNKTN